tara:strand:- start:4496 stop:4789 length:294 start_codon:yes stop_codon:yes gene_type:complete
MVAHLDPDPATAHLVRDGCGGPGTEEAVEDEVAGVRGNVEDALNEAFGFGRSKEIFSEESQDLFLGLVCVTRVVVRPPSPRHHAFDFVQKSNDARLR